MKRSRNNTEIETKVVKNVNNNQIEYVSNFKD